MVKASMSGAIFLAHQANEGAQGLGRHSCKALYKILEMNDNETAAQYPARYFAVNRPNTKRCRGAPKNRMKCKSGSIT